MQPEPLSRVANRCEQQVYVWRANTTSTGNQSIPLQDLKAFARSQLLAVGESQHISVTIPLADLVLVDADGTERLLPGVYHVAVGGTAPNTPDRLLAADPGSPHPPVRLEFNVQPEHQVA